MAGASKNDIDALQDMLGNLIRLEISANGLDSPVRVHLGEAARQLYLASTNFVGEMGGAA
jgi:hypothetical protein